MKLWNYNENLNILTINNTNLKSSSLFLDNNSFYLLYAGYNKYIGVYNSGGDLYKKLGNNDGYRCYLNWWNWR